MTNQPLSAARRLPSRLELADHAVVLTRSGGEVQVGVDPRRALVFAGPGYAALLHRLRRPATPTDLQAVGRRAGLAGRDVTAAARRLQEAGLLAPDPAGPDRRVRLVGAGPIGLALARYLVAGGVAELAVFDRRSPDPDLYPAADPRSDQAGALAATLADDRAVVVPLDHWSKPETLPVDLTVLVTDGPEVDRVIPDQLVRLDQPHLLVRSLGNAVWVGPLVLPGRTPCLRCTDLTRTDADPGWPAVLTQLSRVRLAVPDLLAGWGASVAATQALSFLAGGEPETLGATLELSAADLRTERRRWPQHAGCGCRWEISTEWGV